MRTMVIVMVGCCAVLFAQGEEPKEFVPGQTKALHWKKLEKVIKSARKNYKPILLYVYSKEHPDLCRQIEEMLEESSVRIAAARFVSIKIDGDDEETEEFRANIGLKKDEMGLFLCDCRFKIKERYQGKSSLDDPKEFAHHLKKFAKEHAKFAKKLKVLDKIWAKVGWAEKKQRWRDYYALLEQFREKAREAGEDERLKDAQNVIESAIKEGNRLLDEAEKLVDQVERSFRWGGTRGFRQDLVYEAQKRLMRVSSRYPLKELTQRGVKISARLTAVCQEYQKRLQEQQQKSRKR